MTRTATINPRGPSPHPPPIPQYRPPPPPNSNNSTITTMIRSILYLLQAAKRRLPTLVYACGATDRATGALGNDHRNDGLINSRPSSADGRPLVSSARRSSDCCAPPLPI